MRALARLHRHAAGWVAPSPVVYTEKGPPHIGTTGWLGHLDLPSLHILLGKEIGDRAPDHHANQIIACDIFHPPCVHVGTIP